MTYDPYDYAKRAAEEAREKRADRALTWTVVFLYAIIAAAVLIANYGCSEPDWIERQKQKPPDLYPAEGNR